MSTLPEIVNSASQILKDIAAVDGEISPELEALLAASDKELVEKSDKYCGVLEMLDQKHSSLVFAADARYKAAQGVSLAMDRLKQRLLNAMSVLGKTTMSGEEFTVYRLKALSVKVTDQSLIPQEYKFTPIVEERVEKNKLKKALKELETIPGAELETTEFIRVVLSTK